MIKFENPVTRRYFYINVHKDALGDMCIHIIRGGLYHVRHITLGYNCPDKINKEIERLTKRRIARGYVQVS